MTTNQPAGRAGSYSYEDNLIKTSNLKLDKALSCEAAHANAHP